MPEFELQLPREMVSFLNSGESFQFLDPADEIEFSNLSLFHSNELKIQNFPVIYNSEIDGDWDPNKDRSGRYLVAGISIVKTCDNYSADGLLLWLPTEERFGAWDDDHLELWVFSETVDWDSITKDPGGHLQASCGGDGQDPPFRMLQPWHNHPYVEQSLEGVQPYPFK